MNEFTPKEIKQSSKYLQERLEQLKAKGSNVFNLEKKKENSTLKKFVSIIGALVITFSNGSCISDEATLALAYPR